MMTPEQIAQARVRAYLARRAIANGHDPEHIHGYDVSKNSPEGVSLTVSDLTALLAALEAAEAKLAKAVEALDYCINAPFSGWTIAQGYARAILAEIKSSKAAPPYGLEGENHE